MFHDGTVVTMDAERSIREHTSVAVRGGRIIEVGSAAALRAKYATAKTIDCTRKAILPGMVDLHGYLGGSLLKSVGQNLGGGERRKMLEELLPAATDEEWWEVDTQLNALERLKMGTTCMFSMMGGNGTRTDDVVFTQIAARELERIGLRTRIGPSPARPPWPRGRALENRQPQRARSGVVAGARAMDTPPGRSYRSRIIRPATARG